MSTEFFVAELYCGPDVLEGASQLVMMRVALGKTIIVNEDLQLAFAQPWAIKVRQVVNRGARRMHRRLVDQMHIAQKIRIACDRQGQAADVPKEWHARWPMLLDDFNESGRKSVDRIFA